MYGYRQSTEDALVTNLNSISSSLTSIETIGRRTGAKASASNLITQRSHSVASTSLLWRTPKEDRFANGRNGARYAGSEIYRSNQRALSNVCFKSETALNFLLVPYLLLTITRQVFDFLGQIWLQILINFFTIIIIIVALFGIRQQRISYLGIFAFWALFNTVWNIVVICIHTKLRDVGLNEDALSFYTGATSWWHLNGPGCLPYNISSIQPSISIVQPNIITGCRLNYHLIEASQAAVHATLSLLTTLVSCCVISNIRRLAKKAGPNANKLYRMNNLTKDRSKVNSDPYPSNTSSRFDAHTASLRRAANRAGSRSSRHSVSSNRSARRRVRQPTDASLPTPRGSTSSAQRSQKYGSLSSRRSHKDRRGDVSSLTYGTTGDRGAGGSRRTRLSSLSSAEYLPSYQPPHSSSANLLSSYGEISSIDSYNNNNSNSNRRRSKNRPTSSKIISNGNTNPTYTGSRSSVYSHAANGNNYDDLSYIYGNNSIKNSESHYTASTSGVERQQIYQSSKSNSNSNRYGSGPRNGHSSNGSQRLQAETYQMDPIDTSSNGDTVTKSKLPMNGGSFQSFSTANQQNNRSHSNERKRIDEVNNNYVASNYHETYHDTRPRQNGIGASQEAQDNLFNLNAANLQQQQMYANQRNLRHPIYSNQNNKNSETPI